MTGTALRNRSTRSETTRHAISIAAITIFLALAARTWTGLDTPDSSFYTSLAIFGDQITDRAPFDSYYWTRLGYIAPLHALYSIVSPDIGFFLYRLVLLAVTVTGIYVILLKITKTNFTTRIFLTTAAASSTVILSYLGNPYLTGFILAATTAGIALALHSTLTATIAGGMVVGWSAQVNPAGAILVGTLWLAVSLFTNKKFSHLLQAGIAAAVTFALLIGIGTQIFPGLSWFDTFNSTREMNLSDFASSDLVWLRDISLLVPFAVLLITITAWWRDKSSAPYRLALVLSSVSVTFMLVFSPLMGGIALEAPMYQSMLWPPAMIAFALVFAERISLDSPRTKAMALAGIAVILATGFTQPTLAFAIGIPIAIGAVALSLMGINKSVSSVIVFVVVASTFQLLQNSRTDLGLYYLSPYAWAFAPNPIEEKITAAIDVQQWLLENTTNQDQILTWVDGSWTQGDRELYAVAAMQLWGENRFTLEPTVDDYARAILERTNPSVIALYGRSQRAIDTMLASLNANNTPTSAPQCLEFDWPQASNSNFPADSGIVCLTRLTSQQAR